MYPKIYLGLYSCPIHILSCTKHIISGSYHKCVFFFSFQAENKKQNLYPVYKNDDESDPGNYRRMSLLSIFSRMYHRLISSLCTIKIGYHITLVTIFTYNTHIMYTG